MSEPSLATQCLIAFAVVSSVPQADCPASTIFDDFSQFPFEERVDFSSVTGGNVDILVRQDAGAFRRNVALGSVSTFPRDGSAFVGVSGPDRSEFYAHTDSFAETFFLRWTFSEPFSLGEETTAIAFDVGDVTFPNLTGQFRFGLTSQGIAGTIAERDFVDIAPGSTWLIDISEISALGMDPTSVKEMALTSQSVSGGTSFSIRQVRLIPEPCLQMLVVEAVVLSGLLGRLRGS
jgi:hypothetical protein